LIVATCQFDSDVKK